MNPGDIILCLIDMTFYDGNKHYKGHAYQLESGDESHAEQDVLDGYCILLHGVN